MLFSDIKKLWLSASQVRFRPSENRAGELCYLCLCILPEPSSVYTSRAKPQSWHGTISSRVHWWGSHAVVIVSHTALVILQAVVAMAITHLHRRAQGPHSPAHLGLCCIWVKLLAAWGPVARV